MNRCPKIEYGRLSGEIGWAGVNSRVISSKKPIHVRQASELGLVAVRPGAPYLSLPTFFVFVATTAIFLTAASMSRIYVSDGRFVVIVIAMLLYIVGNLLMVRIMREVGLGIAISVSTFAQLILINVVAYVFFEERPAPLQIAGLVLGGVSMALIMLPTGPR